MAVLVGCAFLLVVVGAIVGRTWPVEQGPDRPYMLVLRDDAAQSDVEDLHALLESLPSIQGVVYVSKAQALERFKRQAAGSPGLLEALDATANPLPASLDIHFSDQSETTFQEFLRTVEQWSGFHRTVADSGDPEWWFRY